MTCPGGGSLARGPSSPLRTNRLVLNRPVLADALVVYEINHDFRAVEHNPSDRLSSLHEAQALVQRWMEHWQQFGFGYWCVREVGSAAVIGFCGLKVVTFQGAEALNLLYRFSPPSWGRGIATEAASAVVDWTLAHEPQRPLLARVRPGNVASQRVALRVGRHRVPALDEDGEDGPDLLFMY